MTERTPGPRRNADGSLSAAALRRERPVIIALAALGLAAAGCFGAAALVQADANDELERELRQAERALDNKSSEIRVLQSAITNCSRLAALDVTLKDGVELTLVVEMDRGIPATADYSTGQLCAITEDTVRAIAAGLTLEDLGTTPGHAIDRLNEDLEGATIRMIGGPGAKVLELFSMAHAHHNGAINVLDQVQDAVDAARREIEKGQTRISRPGAGADAKVPGGPN